MKIAKLTASMCLSLCALLPTITAFAEPAPAFLGRWGSTGTGDGKFRRLGGIAVDAGGFLYAADLYGNKIEKFSPSGEAILRWGSPGSSNGRFLTPTDVAVDQSGNVFVADFDNYRIQKFTSSGVYLHQWPIADETHPLSPLYVAAGTDGSIYVTANYYVFRFDANGTLLDRWGRFGYSEPGAFSNMAYGLTWSGGNLYVADHGNDRIQRFSSSGTFISEWRTRTDAYEMGSPLGVGSDASGNIYVCGDSQVHKFSATGVFLVGWGGRGTGDGQFAEPTDIAIGSNGIIFVADGIHDDIQLFGDMLTPTRHESWSAIKGRYR